MSNNTKVFKLSEICRLITDGKHGDCADELDSGFFFISAKDVKDGKIQYDDARQITRADFEDTHRRTRLEPDDILITNSGTIGRLAFVPDAEITRRTTFQKSVAIIKPDKSAVFPKFLYYTFQAQLQYLIEMAGGTAQKNLLLGDLRRFQCRVPSYSLQRKIAAILSAYDELIENNRRRIALLERLAEEIYREWFVRLRFPGHQKVKKVKGVPQGWEIKRISEVVNFRSGYSFKSETYTPAGKFGIVTIKNVQDGYFIPECSDFIDEPPSNMKAHCVLHPGDVLMSLTGNVGRVCHVYGTDLLLNQRVAKLESRLKEGSQFVYYIFNNRSMIQLIENLSLGSTAQMNLSPIQLGKQKLVVPSSDLLKQFETAIQPVTDLKLNLLNQSQNLKITRDRVLPRLISGKLSVEELDIQFPPGMKEEMEAAA